MMDGMSDFKPKKTKKKSFFLMNKGLKERIWEGMLGFDGLLCSKIYIKFFFF